MRFEPYPYQRRAIEFVERHDHCALFLDMGLGKTVSTLTAVQALMRDTLEVERTLVIAPKAVALNTWSGECSKWDHLRSLRVSIVMGTAAQRQKALTTEADVYVTNRDNTEWIASTCHTAGHPWPFDCVILDESSSFKNPQAKRWKVMKRLLPYIKRLVLLTGTPSPNGLSDLWAQAYLLDQGQRLEKNIGTYRLKYFYPGAHNGAVVYQWLPRKGAAEQIAQKLSDICLSMKAADYLSLPDVIDGGMTLTLPAKELAAYRQFERDCVASLEDGAEIVAQTAVALTTKLLQFAGGAVYDDAHSWHTVSTVKADALAELCEASTSPVLVYYNYQHERDRIASSLPDVVNFHGEPEILERWNRGEIHVMMAHPASVAFGLNMQQGGHTIVWFSPTWNLELYLQANARLHRQGQQHPVILYHLIARGTMDETVMAALKGKRSVQDVLLERLKAMREELR